MGAQAILAQTHFNPAAKLKGLVFAAGQSMANLNLARQLEVLQLTLKDAAFGNNDFRLPGFFDGETATVGWHVYPRGCPKTFGIVKSRRWDEDLGTISSIKRDGCISEHPDSELCVDPVWARGRLAELEDLVKSVPPKGQSPDSFDDATPLSVLESS